jgi:hypothetical protein
MFLIIDFTIDFSDNMNLSHKLFNIMNINNIRLQITCFFFAFLTRDLLNLNIKNLNVFAIYNILSIIIFSRNFF